MSYWISLTSHYASLFAIISRQDANYLGQCKIYARFWDPMHRLGLVLSEMRVTVTENETVILRSGRNLRHQWRAYSAYCILNTTERRVPNDKQPFCDRFLACPFSVYENHRQHVSIARYCIFLHSTRMMHRVRAMCANNTARHESHSRSACTRQVSCYRVSSLTTSYLP